ncbi:hypothetical protein AAES_02734 [Amazona aestiva]|uniref:Uncharacterized protein n=1 Tax=Amazona aestiva TaxID=12930 RepID=A0A0Q3U531_AMAAE|nr:hypothetical protein AAES_02734 [Amazona aestiva]
MSMNLLPGTASDQESSSHESEEEEEESKIKGPAQEIQFWEIKWQDGHLQIPRDVINKITAMSPPTNKKETQAFLGAVGLWGMHIPNYSLIVSPHYHVTRKKNDFKWGPEQQAFEQIKRDTSCSGPRTSLYRARCEKCTVHHSWGEWSYLEPLAESSRGDSRLTPQLLQYGIQRI